MEYSEVPFLKWVHYGIIFVCQLFNKEGHTYSYEEFLAEYKFPVLPRQFAIGFDAVPSGVTMLMPCIGQKCTYEELQIGNPELILKPITNVLEVLYV